MIRYILKVILWAVIWIAIVSLGVKVFADEGQKQKPISKRPNACFQCLNNYAHCRLNIEQDSNREDLLMQCEDSYRTCFFSHKCMYEGVR